MSQADFVVIGAGIAGASVAAHLAENHRVVLVEREDRPGYHSTGRSAALFTEIYGNPVIRALTRGSRKFLFGPPESFAQSPLTRLRGCLYVATEEQLPELHSFASLPDVAPATRALSSAEAYELCPILREGYVAGALYEPDSSDIDVAALHQGYLRWFRARSGRLLVNAPLEALERKGAGWRVRAAGESIEARVIVNAAGAWADPVARLAGLRPLSLTPRRRTAVLVDPPAGLDISRWPFVNDIAERFYFKPEAGALFLSPADETPTEPCDAQPDEWDVATAVERVEAATTLEVKRLKARWAGLRTFAPDRTPIVGFSAKAENFFWLAGQGGYGIQTAPALSRIAASLALRASLPDDLEHMAAHLAELSPARFERAAHPPTGGLPP
jgi:D-arginine dehydrogenase